jgi:hypothetical protein
MANIVKTSEIISSLLDYFAASAIKKGGGRVFKVFREFRVLKAPKDLRNLKNFKAIIKEYTALAVKYQSKLCILLACLYLCNYKFYGRTTGYEKEHKKNNSNKLDCNGGGCHCHSVCCT